MVLIGVIERCGTLTGYGAGVMGRKGRGTEALRPRTPPPPLRASGQHITKHRMGNRTYEHQHIPPNWTTMVQNIRNVPNCRFLHIWRNRLLLKTQQHFQPPSDTSSMNGKSLHNFWMLSALFFYAVRNGLHVTSVIVCIWQKKNTLLSCERTLSSSDCYNLSYVH